MSASVAKNVGLLKKKEGQTNQYPLSVIICFNLIIYVLFLLDVLAHANKKKLLEIKSFPILTDKPSLYRDTSSILL